MTNKIKLMAFESNLKHIFKNFTKELKFHPTRKWRFDYAIPDLKIAIEIEGAVYANGRHTRGSGYVKDLEKYNQAALLGWSLYRFTYQNLIDESTNRLLKQARDSNLSETF